MVFPFRLKSLHHTYRLITAMTLIGLAVTGTAMAAEEDWPDPVYFPQRQDLPPPPGPFRTEGESVLPEEDTPRKRGFWPFKRKRKTESQAAASDATERGKPYDPPSRPDPLLRLAMPIVSDTGTIPAGFYLVQKAGGTGDRLDLTLARQNRILLRFTAHRASPPSDNQEKFGTPNPITPTPNSLPGPLKTEVRLSPDQKSVTIILKEGQNQFESAPFPVATDTRPLLRH